MAADPPVHKPYNNSRPKSQYTKGGIETGKTIECIYEDNVLKPVGKIQLREGERIRVTIEKKLSFEPIRLKKKPASERISALREPPYPSSKII